LGLGADGGWFLKVNVAIKLRIMPVIAETYSMVSICSLNCSWLSLSEMNHAGSVKPTAAPNAYPAITTVNAITLSFGANHVLANFAGLLHKKGCPTAQTTYPAAQIQKLSLIKHLMAIPRVVDIVPISTASLHPCSSIMKLLGKVKQM
jgi:hypothetical protein